MAWEIELYTTEKGECPVEAFILKIPKKAQAKVARYIRLLTEFGLQLREPYVRDITGISKLKELRIPFRTDAYRIFYFAFTGQKFVLVHAIQKKTPKTPKRDLQIAEARLNDYLARHQGGNQ